MTERTAFVLLLLVVVALSIGGIIISILVTKDPSDAGRGGALAVCLSFAALFLSRGYGTKVYDILSDEVNTIKDEITNLGQQIGTGAQTGTSIQQRLDALITKIRTDSDAQRIQNIFLALTSIIGTFTWGFGDMIARWLMNCPHHS